jgi:hypothetical protein
VKKIVVLSVPLIMLVSVVLTFAMLEAQRKPDWKMELDDYFNSKRSTEILTIIAENKATQPWNFDKTMGIPAKSNQFWSSTELSSPLGTLRCVLVEKRYVSTPVGKEKRKRQVIYVGYYSDTLWQVGWLVFEGSTEPFTQNDVAHLSTLGCDLNLE